MVRSRILPIYNQNPSQRFPVDLDLLDIDMIPVVQGDDLNDWLKPEGEVEQMAFKGWIQQIYCIWEDRHRKLLKKAFGGRDILLETSVMGDFRRIRNDLIHNGVASKERVGKCEILKWFKPGDPIILGMRHVFDFLNQMGFLDSYWILKPETKKSNDKKPLPKLISIRPLIDNDLEQAGSIPFSKEKHYRYVVSVVFENGVFCNVPFIDCIEALSTEEKDKLFKKVEIDENGNLSFPNGCNIQASSLYDACILCHSGQGQAGKGIPGPPLRLK